MPVLVELVKIAALAALVGMLLAYAVPAFVAATVAVAAFWLLLVKAS